MYLCVYVCIYVCMCVYVCYIYTYMYVCRHDISSNINIVYTATTQTDFIRIVATNILAHFIVNCTILMFKWFYNTEISTIIL